jgi:hypothetical protein
VWGLEVIAGKVVARKVWWEGLDKRLGKLEMEEHFYGGGTILKGVD